MLKKSVHFCISLSSLLILLSPLLQAQTQYCPMSYSPQFLACMAAYERARQSAQEVVVTGTKQPADTAGPGYLVTPENNAPRDMQGNPAQREQFCRTEKGNILSTRANCRLSASERDVIRQNSCTNVSLSWNGFGWTNPCRDDSALTYRTDMARCDKYYQDNINAYNAICGK